MGALLKIVKALTPITLSDLPPKHNDEVTAWHLKALVLIPTLRFGMWDRQWYEVEGLMLEDSYEPLSSYDDVKVPSRGTEVYMAKVARGHSNGAGSYSGEKPLSSPRF